MTENGYSLSDIAAVSGNGWGNGFGGDGGGWWGMLVLFALLFGFGGNWGGFGGNGFANAIGYENLATSNEVQRGFDNQNSMANQREILAAVNAGTAQSVAATNQSFHDTLGVIQNTYNEITRDIAGLAVGQANQLAAQNQCCCDTKMLISETGAQQRYESAMQNNAVLQAIREEGAQTRSVMQQDKIDTLQNRVNQLELQQATANVVRYPNGFVYNAGPSPFCGGGCCGGWGNV